MRVTEGAGRSSGMCSWYFLEAVKGAVHLQVMHVVRQLNSVLQEENKVFLDVAMHQGGERWNLSTGPEVSITGPENILTAGSIKQSLYTITSFTWSDATWLRNNEVYYCGASTPELESGMQPHSPSALPLLPAAVLDGGTGRARNQMRGDSLWHLRYWYLLRILISQISFIKGKI